MLIALLSENRDYFVSGQDIIRIFYPEAAITSESVGDLDLTLSVFSAREGSVLVAGAHLSGSGVTMSEQTTAEKIPVSGDERNHQKRLVKLALFRLLSKFTGKPPGPWGILTGIRPTKIVQRLLDIGWVQRDIIEYLVINYDMDAQKAVMLTELAVSQRRYLLSSDEAGRLISVYIGIPFCPTRCAYCSFPAYPVNRSQQLLTPFLAALDREISALGEFLRNSGKQIQTIYVGGGTPTVLTGKQLAGLLERVQTDLISEHTSEITLEAGRPDTVTEEKLRIALEYGVTRLSINPQTMNVKTLEVIGRDHSPDDIIKSLELARGLGFKNINMDIILGLPGEALADVKNTLEELTLLKPENLTVHTLALKRTSTINADRDSFRLPVGEEVSRMLELTADFALKMGMHPYYLYRQKNIVGHLENIGYALSGFDCLYNIQMIEERQTVLGFGGGAGSKFVEPGTWYLTSHYNPKDPENYITRIDEIIERKTGLLQNFFGSITK